MTTEQIAICLLLAATLALFAWGRWRYDVVALTALLAAVLLGLVPTDSAFSGFAHPAVITVAAVLVLGRALMQSGVIDWLAERLVPSAGPAWIQVGGLCLIVSVLSAFMNNVGALALLMPVAIAAAGRSERSPAIVLMPMAFTSMLGGLITLIGTPPNIIISNYRADALGAPFEMFSFAPVGGGLAILGLVFVALVGWRLLPRRHHAGRTELYGIQEYITEAKVPAESRFVGKSVAELEKEVESQEARVLSLIRGERQIPAFAPWERIQGDDILILQAAPDAIEGILKTLDLALIDQDKAALDEALEGHGMGLTEAVVMPRSLIAGNTALEIRLRSRYGINLLAVAREGHPHRGRLRSFRFQAGDVLLLQGPEDQINGALSTLGCLPLAQRELRIGVPRRAATILAVALGAIAIAAVDLLPVAIALTAAVVILMLLRVMPLSQAYDAIDWSVIVLLGALLPVGEALQSTGTTDLIAGQLLSLSGELPPWVLLALVMIVTMTISDIVNNAATAVMMAPIAVGIATGLDANPDAFLMAAAVGASCAFLTPIGHQNNTLVMGPGGYRFWDYWRMGLPVEIIVVAAGVPLILLFWPL
ncbi:SLC13 family permease [Marinibaculum pumilum]|uniref:SLC13 family permease n=1 Tax=Marinibaculum pumilum TaxID=1766165 RepID=A0ABV7L6A1_9PROT